MTELRQQAGIAAKALQFTILVACRTGEALGARWCEINFEDACWTVPAERTKTGKELRVPLSSPVLELLRGLPVEQDNPFVFVGRFGGRGLGNTALIEVLRPMRPGVTVHGFRSAFRDWAAERTSHPNHIIEMCLGHSIGNAVEKAYRRGDLFEKRKLVMADWAAYVDGAVADNVVPLRAAV